MAMCLQTATQRANCPFVKWTKRHVARLVIVIADHAPQPIRAIRVVRERVVARYVISTFGNYAEQNANDERCTKRNPRRICRYQGAESPRKSRYRHHRSNRHRATAYGVDVVQVSPLELDERRADSQGLKDDEIGENRSDPCDGHVGV